MDYVHLLTDWLLHYGSIILFLSLALGIVGLPIPDETLLFISGWLMCKGCLGAFSTCIAAILGSVTGITMSYLLGYYAAPVVLKKYFRIKEEKIAKVNNWYAKIGKWTLLVGYYIPVIRHVTGFVAGSTRLKYTHFMLFAYTGALFWVTTFLFLGYFVRNEITQRLIICS